MGPRADWFEKVVTGSAFGSKDTKDAYAVFGSRMKNILHDGHANYNCIVADLQ